MPTRARLVTPRFALVTAAGLAYFLALGVLIPVLPRYVEDSLGGSSVAVGIAVGAFAVGAVLLRPYAGRLGDRYGRRLLVVTGALIVAVSSLLYAASSSMGPLVLARILGGMGEASFFVGAGTMVTDLAPTERRGEAISYWSIAVYGGLAFGPALGEAVQGSDRYHAVWFTSAALAGLAALLGVFTRETMPARVEGEAPARAPLLHRAAIVPGSILFLGLVGLAGFSAFVPLYVPDIGLSNSRAVFLLYGVLILVVRIAGARLPDRLGSLVAGSGALGFGALGLLVLAAWPAIAGLLLGTVVFAIGMSLMYPALLTLSLSGVPDTERASVVGTFSTFFDLSQGLGALILGVVAAFAGYRGAFAAGGVLAIAGLALLRSGIDPRARRGTPAVHAELEIPEPEPGT